MSKGLRQLGEELQPGHQAQHMGLRRGPVRMVVTFPATAQKELNIAHTLGRPPRRWRVVGGNTTAVIFDGDTPHDSGTLRLKSTVSDAQVTLEVE